MSVTSLQGTSRHGVSPAPSMTLSTMSCPTGGGSNPSSMHSLPGTGHSTDHAPGSTSSVVSYVRHHQDHNINRWESMTLCNSFKKNSIAKFWSCLGIGVGLFLISVRRPAVVIILGRKLHMFIFADGLLLFEHLYPALHTRMLQCPSSGVPKVLR